MSTINITGTGGIIEGNLGAANVNVNLDAALDFDGSNDIVDLNYGSGVNAQAGFSVSFWAKLDDNFSGTNQMFIGSSTGTNQRFYIGNDGLRWSFGYASAGWSEAGSQTAFAGAWHHVCVTATSGAQKLYVNGVEITAQAKTDSSTFTLASDLGAGAMFGGAYFANGTMADIKIFGDVLTAAEVQELASKINYDISVGSIDNLTRWFKSNAGSGTTIADDSGNSGTAADISGATWIYDQYSVDVQDNSTTTDGTFTVTQGKVEGLALTSLTFDGSGDIINVGDSNAIITGTDVTYACWVKVDNGYANTVYLIANQKGAGSTNMSLAVNRDASGNSAGKIDGFVWNGSSHIHTVYDAGINDGKWHHIVFTTTGSSQVLYFDGVQVATGSGAFSNSASTDDMSIGAFNAASPSDSLDGNMRDVRIYDYALSAERAASLYSNTYPQTPDHWWKIDEGSGSAVEDYGTGTDADGTITGATYSNGTLDLDGTFTLLANGTLSAPRGDLELAAATTFAANTFVHNNGRVVATNAGTVEYRFSSDNAGSDNPLYDFQNQADGQVRFLTGFIIENSHSHSGGNQYNYISSDRTYNYGTTSSAASITTLLRSVVGTASNYANIYGVSSLYPVNLSTWDDTPLYTNVALKNVNVTVDIGAAKFASASNGNRTVRLDGDCEFDAVAVDTEDTLDINGQRVKFGGDVTYQGTIDADGLLVFHGGFTKYGTLNNAASGDIMTMSTSGFPTFSYITGYRTFFANGGVQLGTGGFTSIPNAIIASGELKTGTRNCSATNLTIATGGTFDADNNTHTVSGDFTTSGGLIGTSALNLTGSEEVTGTDNLDEVATSNRVTVEAWFKATTDANYRAIFSRGTSWSTGNIYLYMNGNGNVQFSMNDLGATVTSTTAGLADGKWHHAAATYDQTNLKLYIDGKLEASAAYTDAINTQTNGFKIGDRSGANWEGQIGRVSIWDAALTEAQIREMLFYDFATADSEATIPDANCIGWWQFDEGTGTAVADSSTNNADGTLNSAAWAGAGTFTMGASTLDLTGNGEWAISNNTTDYYNVNVAASGKTTTINSVGGSEKRPRINNLLTHGGGTLTDISNADIVFQGTGTHNAGADLSGLYITYWPSSTDIPGGTYQFLITQHNDLLTTGDITCTGYFAISTSEGFDLKDQTLTTPRFINYANSTFNMDAGSIVFTSANGLTGDYSGRTFTAGPGATITGVAAKSGFFSENNYVVVGKVENLDVTNEELSVTGQVINCTGDIIQQHPTIDHDQQLDYDTADDRDIHLGRDLDKNTELINS